jgi:beta-alanine degradation protein BauB
MISAIGTVQLDNDHFCVTEWRFAPGASTGWHKHTYDYVVVPMTTGQLTITTADETFTADLTAGESYSRVAGTEHDVLNSNDYDFVFIEIERK